MSDKAERLRQLALKRKADRLGDHCCLSEFHDGAYDRHDHVSPWTLSAGNVDTDLMILLQDWSSSDSLERGLDCEVEKLGYTPKLATNVALISLVERHFGLRIEETYVTNLFVFIKKGPMSARIPMRDAVYCAEHYAIPQVEIVQPRMALCVGLQAFNALRLARGQRRASAGDVADNPISIGATRVHGVPHTGAWGLRNAGGIAKVDEIWRRLAVHERPCRN